MQITHLPTFVNIVETGSISRAAKRLHYAQSSATAHVQALERLLGIQLLERTPAGMRPTLAGERLYRYACNILALVDDAKEAVTNECDRRAVHNADDQGVSAPLLVVS